MPGTVPGARRDRAGNAPVALREPFREPFRESASQKTKPAPASPRGVPVTGSGTGRETRFLKTPKKTVPVSIPGCVPGTCRDTKARSGVPFYHTPAGARSQGRSGTVPVTVLEACREP